MKYYFCPRTLDESVRELFNQDTLADKVLFRIKEKVAGKELSVEEFENALKEVGKIVKKEKGFYVIEVEEHHFPVKISKNKERNCYEIYLSI